MFEPTGRYGFFECSICPSELQSSVRTLADLCTFNPEPDLANITTWMHDHIILETILIAVEAYIDVRPDVAVNDGGVGADECGAVLAGQIGVVVRVVLAASFGDDLRVQVTVHERDVDAVELVDAWLRFNSVIGSINADLTVITILYHIRIVCEPALLELHVHARSVQQVQHSRVRFPELVVYLPFVGREAFGMGLGHERKRGEC
jgi:hypothetical protein